MRLRRNQLCPIHRSQFCCGREAIPRESRQHQLGVRRIDDPPHPRGYREIRSNAEMRKLLDKKIVAQNGVCGICKERFTDYGDIVPDHISPRGMGGAWRDDHRRTFRLSTGGATEKRAQAGRDCGSINSRLRLSSLLIGLPNHSIQDHPRQTHALGYDCCQAGR